MQSHGLHDFTVDEAHRLLGGSLQRVQAGLSKLAAKGVLVRPAKGLYVIVAPEYRGFKSLKDVRNGIARWQAEMLVAASERRFEDAAKLRDRVKNLKQLELQLLTSEN